MLRILVVEDDESMKAVITRLLQKDEYEVSPLPPDWKLKNSYPVLSRTLYCSTFTYRIPMVFI
ncbi:MAG: response regulator [Bacteroidales bacterium]|nr:response regulator [Bacteroidales bacterium]